MPATGNTAFLMGFMSFSKIFDSMAPTLAGRKSLAAALRGGSLIGNLNLRIIPASQANCQAACKCFKRLCVAAAPIMRLIKHGHAQRLRLFELAARGFARRPHNRFFSTRCPTLCRPAASSWLTSSRLSVGRCTVKHKGFAGNGLILIAAAGLFVSQTAFGLKIAASRAIKPDFPLCARHCCQSALKLCRAANLRRFCSANPHKACARVSLNLKPGRRASQRAGCTSLRRRQANRLRLRRHTGGQQIIYHRGLGRVGKKVRRRMRHHAADIGQAGERRLGRGAHIGQRAESLRQYCGGALAHMGGCPAQRERRANSGCLLASMPARMFRPIWWAMLFQAV